MPQRLARELGDHLEHAGRSRDAGDGGTLPHQVAHAEQEPAAEHTVGVKPGRNPRGPNPLASRQGGGQRVAQRHHHRGAGRRRQPQRAGLLNIGQGEARVGQVAERIARRGHRHGRHPGTQPQGVVCEAGDLGGSALGERDDDVAPVDQADVAVERLQRVQERGLRPRAGQRGGHLPGDEPALPIPVVSSLACEFTGPVASRTASTRRSNSESRLAAQQPQGVRLLEQDALGRLEGRDRRTGRAHRQCVPHIRRPRPSDPPRGRTPSPSVAEPPRPFRPRGVVIATFAATTATRSGAPSVWPFDPAVRPGRCKGAGAPTT